MLSPNQTSTEPPLLSSVPEPPQTPPPGNDIYTVIIRGEEFQLTHAQISFDSPNHFLDCFTSGFLESRERVLRLDRNPSLFALIVDYLSGYPILPLTPDSIPGGMGVTTARRYLLADAQYYRLQRLCSQMTMPSLRTPLGWAGLADEMVNLRDVLASTLPDEVIQQADGSVVSRLSGNPVLIYAQDVSFRIVVRRLTTDSAPNREPSLSLELSVPSGLAESKSSQLHADGGDPIVSMTDFERNGVLHIDGSPHKLSDVFDWCKSPEKSSMTRNLDASLRGTGVYSLTDSSEEISWVDGRYRCLSKVNNREVTYSYWADMALCTFRPARENQVRKNMLVRAKVRSLHRVLDDLDPGLADTL
ncbi:hypothetical protein K466DRAFT_566526 [Polyporus arcularius HHB13444]|uniref:BTB domain-containing protein n=1 Tax=Polyporus arcularius HHB13444 TaxID=1314778 RepID=A0A5C3P7F1_9APHY|nr:hypothetical protein K466DRAFT_566526 [Polyporus arcularius HHB13444]